MGGPLNASGLLGDTGFVVPFALAVESAHHHNQADCESYSADGKTDPGCVPLAVVLHVVDLRCEFLLEFCDFRVGYEL